jgi:hypothetical protein
MRQQYSTQSPGSTDESREVVSFSIWLLACALLLQENSPRVVRQEHDALREEEPACGKATVSGSGQTPRPRPF